jgi:glycosyltransferase involved in cell wall biosynthesis
MRVSIVTPTIDPDRFIDEAIASVPRVAACEIEHIVVHDLDEAFTPILKARYPHLIVLKGEGAGAAAATALGVDAASGDFIIQLNSDDRLAPKALDRLVECAAMRPDIRIWTGELRVFCQGHDGAEVTIRYIAGAEATAFTLENLMDDLPLLTARFCHRSVFAEIGNFDTNFSESNDREFLIRAYMHGVREAPLGVLVSEMRQHEQSHTMMLRRDVVPPYLNDHLRIADKWLAADLPPALRRKFLAWRARELLRLAFYQASAKQLGAALNTLGSETIRDPMWILRVPSSLSAWRRRRRSQAKTSSTAPEA